MIIGLAFLILSAFFETQPAPDKQVDALIEQLGSPAYREREDASRKLAGMGYKSIPALTKAAETTADAEIRMRALRITNRYYSVSPSSGRQMPLIFTLSDKEVMEAYYYRALDKFLETHGSNWAYHMAWDIYARDATYLVVQDLFKAGFKRSVIQAYIDALDRRENEPGFCPQTEAGNIREVE